MNKEVKAKWVAALRSGEYQQAKGMLRTDVGFCCLGVLCDLYSKDYGGSWKLYMFQGEMEVLPPTVQKWAGLDKPNPDVDTRSLSRHNDGGGADDLTPKSFEEIAALIDQNL